MNPSSNARLRHDLRTPLNHIIGYTEMLLEDVAKQDPADLRPGLQQMHSDAQVVLKRVDALLAADSARSPSIVGLRQDVLAPLGAMAGSLTELQTRAVATTASSALDDLARIESAVAQLRALLTNDGVPAEAVRAAPAGQTVNGPSPPSQRSMVLIVDDDDSSRDLLARRLTREGHAVMTAAGGVEALARLREEPIDLLLLDVMMPGMDGHEVLQQIKGDDTLRNLRVLMISALDETDSVARCIELGAEDYLHKPFDPVILRARIGACLEKKRLRDREVQHLQELSDWNHTLEARVAEQVALVERLTRLKRFFSPPLAEAIVAGGADDPLQPHRREVTVCFLDLRGFTAFAEVSEPEEVMGVLRQFHAEMGRLIMAHEGTLERFTGDGMMVFFNDPVLVPNAPERAVRMALAMREQVARLVHQWRSVGYELDLGIGIAQGYATIGAIGFEGRWDYGAIGSVTNLAARLCGEAEAGQILVTQRVATSTERIARTEAVGALPLKGFQRPVPAHALLGLNETGPVA